MELINTKTFPYAQAESSSETQPTNAKSKSLLLLRNCTSNIIYHQHHQEMVVSYKECLKNHAATLGGHALDGCGEFMPSPTATPTDPASLKCAACGCHRNFHRRDPYDGPAFIHHLPPPTNPSSSPSPTHSPGASPSPTHTPSSPVPYSYYSSAPHMLLALSTGYSGPLDEYHHHLNHSNPTVGRIENHNNSNPSGRKRSRTKFSREQKEKMHAFAERLGWRMPKSEERLIEGFCNEVGVDRGVLKVWMHNNKNTFSKKEILAVGNLNIGSNNNSGSNEGNGNGNAGVSFDSNSDIHNNECSIQLHVSTINGSSSAS
ncbi:PREDICTED: zinc-finger homeodomain protein 11 [Theobroma cacao]|uniref:Zinc-finger homeodomain protein 11 n=1 Tax=Theobroma cacao TaxID=3641 RepID=A0AB32VZ45_THECC|nr:PREDICTED: zinc-finger homeodomain protein 11 [Theobroma cacao]